MLLKASIAVGAVMFVAASSWAIDLRQVYNEMYPVNGLRRDVLSLCHEAKPTFVRAVEADRVGCYDSMPDPVELAIGWVRTSSRLAAMRAPTPVEMAERLMVAALSERRLDRLQPAQFTGYAIATGAARACDEAVAGLRPAATGADLALNLPTELATLGLPSRVALADRQTMAALGLIPGGTRSITAPAPELPVLTLGGAGGSAVGDGAIDPAATATADPARADLGGEPDTLLPRDPPASLCRSRA